MKKILLSAVALTLLATSCKKKEDDNNGGGGGSAPGTFTVGTTTYTATVVSGGGSSALTATANTGGTGGGLTFIFPGSALPTANGTYKVGNILPGPGEVTVSFNWANPIKAYNSTGNDNVNATVTVSGGKVTVDLPKIWAKNATGGTDSVQISGKVTQQ